MVWSAGLLIKVANSNAKVTWHQDLTYWGLDDARELTAWVALSTANRRSGCLRLVSGSHLQRQVPHADSSEPNRSDDRHGHFTVAAPPAGRLLDEDLTRCRADAEAKRAILYAGAEQAGGK